MEISDSDDDVNTPRYCFPFFLSSRFLHALYAILFPGPLEVISNSEKSYFRVTFSWTSQIVKAVFLGSTSTTIFRAKNRTPCNRVLGTISRATFDSATRCEFFNPIKKLVTCCRVKSCTTNRPPDHVTRCSIYRPALLRENRCCKLSPLTPRLTLSLVQTNAQTRNIGICWF